MYLRGEHMPNYFYDQEALCPFFHRSTDKDITCEGITDGCITKIAFNSRKKKKMHSDIFCNKKYENCEVYRMLEKKYED